MTSVPADLAVGQAGRRTAELALLILAVLTAVLAFCAVGVAESGSLPAGVLGYALALTAMFGAAHVVVRRVARFADPLMLPCVALLNGLGVVLIRRLDNASVGRVLSSGPRHARADAPLQLVWTAIGVGVFIAVLLVVRDHTRLARYTYSCAVGGLLLLMLPAVPGVGATINGARLWVHVGPMTVQPSEVAKMLLMVFFAGYLVAKRDVLALASRRVAGLDLPRARDLGPVILAWAGSILVLVREKDLGTSLLFFAMFIVMLYVATERTSWLLIGLALFAVSAVACYHLFVHVHSRVDVWLHPFAKASTSGYQLVQGLFGFGTGGLTGTGLGIGSPATVPFAKTDFIMATIGEELGLAGCMVVLIVFGLIVERGLRAALSCRDSFGKLLATGLAFSLAMQVFVIVGGVSGLIPLTGVTLPWLSYGGSSVVANWALVAVLLRVSDAARAPAPAPLAPGAVRQALADAPTTVVQRP